MPRCTRGHGYYHRHKNQCETDLLQYTVCQSDGALLWDGALLYWDGRGGVFALAFASQRSSGPTNFLRSLGEFAKLFHSIRMKYLRNKKMTIVIN